jgi:hypothetical protein
MLPFAVQISEDKETGSMQTNPRSATTTTAGIEKLAECFRGELSAGETYDLALKNVTHVSVHQTLQEIYVSHCRRADQLRDKIRQLGAEPPKSSGVWGAFAKVFQAGENDQLRWHAPQGSRRQLILPSCNGRRKTIPRTEKPRLGLSITKEGIP